MKWGKENKDNAREMYIHHHENAGKSVRVRVTSLSLHPEMAYLGASADGYVHSDECDGCSETKCPLSMNNSSTISMEPAEIAA